MSKRFKKQLTRTKFEKLLNSSWKRSEPTGRIRETLDGKAITWSNKPNKYVSIKNDGVDQTFTAKSWLGLYNQLDLGGL